jgi:hypothetical protein
MTPTIGKTALRTGRTRLRTGGIAHRTGTTAHRITSPTTEFITNVAIVLVTRPEERFVIYMTTMVIVGDTDDYYQ